MLITEAQMGMGYSTDALALLENMQYLSEAESVYAPAMVPIVENQNLQANVIRLEDMTKFCESNYISDFGAALKAVCEASEVDPSTICFSVQEENVIADQDMAELVAGIMNEGVGVVAVPISESDIAFQLVDTAINHMINTGSDSLLEALATDNYGLILESDEFNYEDMDKYRGGHSASDWSDEKAREYVGSGNQTKDVKHPGLYVRNNPGKIQKAVDWIKENLNNKPRAWLAKQLKRLNTWAVEIDNKVKSLPSDQKGIWATIKQKVVQVIAWISKKLGNLISTKSQGLNYIGRKDPSDADYDKVAQYAH